MNDMLTCFSRLPRHELVDNCRAGLALLLPLPLLLLLPVEMLRSTLALAWFSCMAGIVAPPNPLLCRRWDGEGAEGGGGC